MGFCLKNHYSALRCIWHSHSVVAISCLKTTAWMLSVACSSPAVTPRFCCVTRSQTKWCHRLAAASRSSFLDAESIDIEKDLGSVTLLDVRSANIKSMEVESQEDLRAQLEGLETVQTSSTSDVGIQVRMYSGRVNQGRDKGTGVVLKAYPGNLDAPGGIADALAANELSAHCDLQPPVCQEPCDQLCYLYGGFESSTGQQWLVFRNNGVETAAQYAAKAAQATQQKTAVGTEGLWDGMDPRQALYRRWAFILKILSHGIAGLAFMHRNGRLHQSLGPNSLVLSTLEEMRVGDLKVCLRDLALSVNVSNVAMYGGGTLAEIWEMSSQNQKFNTKPHTPLEDELWKRARDSGAWTPTEKQEFGFSDDVYSAGLLVIYMVFVSLSTPGSIDGPKIQRLVEGTFRSNIMEFRKYCEQEDAWSLAVSFLDYGEGAGWSLLEAMLNPEWRGRPSAVYCLDHPFLSGRVFDDRL